GYIKSLLAPLIFTPCSLPYIISLIGIIILKGSILNGVLILLFFSIGHSIVFLIFSFLYKPIIVLSAKIKDSKVIRLFFGALLILLAVIFLSSIIQPSVHISH
ncbi:MAG: hypothetical protein KGZ81_12440, partial [Flavobacteriales bacterium]|nr:hypothetical protein [Flavobacteriales bacterium]